MILNRNQKIILVGYVALYVLGCLLRALGGRVPESSIQPLVLSFLCYCSICIIFIYHTQKMIPYYSARRFIVSAAVMLLLWKVAETMMTHLFPLASTPSRILWYLTAIPSNYIPNVTLLAVLHLGTRYHENIRKPWYATLYISTAINILMLTNDFNQWTYSFPGGKELGLTNYEYGVGYWISNVWIFFLFGMAIAVVSRMIRVEELRRFRFAVYGVLVAAVAYLAWYASSPERALRQFESAIGDTEIWLGLLLFSFEAIIHLGLVRANYNYPELFEASNLSVRLEDETGVRFQTRRVYPISEEQKAEALKGDIYIDEDHRLHGQEIPGGRMFWVEDLGPINRITRNLEDTQKVLAQENDLIRAENDMIARQTKVDEQNRLYRSMSRRVQPKLDRIEETLADAVPGRADFSRKLARACVYKAYVKRACNMELISQESEQLNIFELESGLRESLDYIGLTGTRTSLRVEGEGFYPPGDIMTLYAFFQDAVEACLEVVAVCEVVVRTEDRELSLSMALEGESIEDREADFRKLRGYEAESGGVFSLDSGEGIVRIRLQKVKGEVRRG